MKLDGFSEQQREALVDLLVLGMYADTHLASAEDYRMRRVLDSLGMQNEESRTRLLDGSISRVRQLRRGSGGDRSYVETLAEAFPEAAERQQVWVALGSLLSSDGKVTAEETEFLAMVRDIFKV